MYVVEIHPIKTPYGWHVRVLFNGVCFAWRIDADTQEQGQQWAQQQIANHNARRVPNCTQCGKPIDLDDNGICDECADDAYQLHLDDMAERAYENMSRQRLGW